MTYFATFIRLKKDSCMLYDTGVYVDANCIEVAKILLYEKYGYDDHIFRLKIEEVKAS